MIRHPNSRLLLVMCSSKDDNVGGFCSVCLPGDNKMALSEIRYNFMNQYKETKGDEYLLTRTKIHFLF